MKVLFKRTGALGDVINMTGVIRVIKRQFANTWIHVATDYPEVFKDNPDVIRIYPSGHSFNTTFVPQENYDAIVDLDLSYERRLDLHVVDAYLLQVRKVLSVDLPISKVSNFVASAEPPNEIVRQIDFERSVVLHPGYSDPSRTWGREFWRGVLLRIRDNGWEPILIGQGRDFKYDEFLCLHGKLQLQEIVWIIERSLGFIGPNSGMFYLAACTSKPILGLFNTVPFELWAPARNGVRGWGAHAVVPNMECIGCRHQLPFPEIRVRCLDKNFACLKQIDPERVLSDFRDLLTRSDLLRDGQVESRGRHHEAP